MAVMHVRLEGISLDSKSKVALYKQLRDGILFQIEKEILQDGDILPPSRQLAKDISVGRNTVIQAYDMLVSTGHLVSETGRGTVVNWRKSTGASAKREESGEQFSNRKTLSEYAARFSLIDCSLAPEKEKSFMPGMPDEEKFPANIFARYISNHTKKMRLETSQYGFEGGWPKLKSQISRHLAITRGINAYAEDIVIVSSAQAALGLLCLLLANPGDVALLENPGYPGAKMAMHNAGLVIRPMEVDEEGADVKDALSKFPEAKLLYLTPTSQYPLCHTLSLERREMLLEHANLHGNWILEDDYDSEFRFTKRPVPALKSIDKKQNVIYVGSFSKTLLPGLRVGYMVLPKSISSIVSNAVWQTAVEPALPLQAAIADFIADGQYGKHLRRMRALYAKKHDLLLELLRQHLPASIPLNAVEGGMNLPILLPDEFDDKKIVAAGNALGLTLRSLSGYNCGGKAYNGILLGFACVSESAMKGSVEKLASIFSK